MSSQDGDSWEPVVGSGVPEVVADRGYWVKSSQIHHTADCTDSNGQRRKPPGDEFRESVSYNLGMAFCWCRRSKMVVNLRDNFGEPLRNLEGDIVRQSANICLCEFGRYISWRSNYEGPPTRRLDTHRCGHKLRSAVCPMIPMIIGASGAMRSIYHRTIRSHRHAWDHCRNGSTTVKNGKR